MPEYHLIKDIITPFMRASKAWKKTSTQKTQASDVKSLERIFAAHYVTHQPRDLCQHRKIVTGEIVSQYRERRKLEGIAPSTIARELSLASAACKWAISELNLDIPNPFQGRLMSRVDRKRIRPRSRILDDGEESRLLIALPQPARDLMLLYLETAMRVGKRSTCATTSATWRKARSPSRQTSTSRGRSLRSPRRRRPSRSSSVSRGCLARPTSSIAKELP